MRNVISKLALETALLGFGAGIFWAMANALYTVIQAVAA